MFDSVHLVHDAGGSLKAFSTIILGNLDGGTEERLLLEERLGPAHLSLEA